MARLRADLSMALRASMCYVQDEVYYYFGVSRLSRS